MMNYILIIVLVFVLIIAIFYFIKGIPINFYIAKGRIIKWDKRRGDSNLIEFFPVVEYYDRKGNKITIELKDQSVGWIKPVKNYNVLLLVDKKRTRLLLSALSQPLLSLMVITLLIILIVSINKMS